MNIFSKNLIDTIKTLSLKDNEKQRYIVYLEGGYYDTRFGPNEFSINTLNACSETAEEVIKKQYKLTRVLLGVLINNIGISCGEDVCTIGKPEESTVSIDDTILPESLQQMLQKSKVAKEDQIITNERTLRNRGIRTAKNIIQKIKNYTIEQDVNDNNDTLYSIIIDGKKIPLAIKKGEKWAARCPLIMGQHYSDLYVKIAKKYGNGTSQLLIDMCEMYDRHKVNNGAKVALVILHDLYGFDTSNLKIVNFSFKDDELIQYEYDVMQGNK